MIYDILPVNSYRGNGSSTKFDFDFYIENESQLNVFLFDKTGVKYKLELDVDYSINEVKNKNGSYINYPIHTSMRKVLSEDEKISIELTLPISQETQYNNSSLLNLEALEYSLDYLTRLIQILARKLSLCVNVEGGDNNSVVELLGIIDEKLKQATQYCEYTKENFDNFIVKYYELLEYGEILEDNAQNLSQLQNYVNTVSQLSKKLQFSNCVLEAPNGVLEFDNNTITIKPNVKLAIPDGRNVDGTLKTIEKTIPAPISHTLGSSEIAHHVFWFDDLGYAAGWGGVYIISEKTPPVSSTNSATIWYNPRTNYFKRSDNGAPYETVQVCYLGKIFKNSGSDIEFIEPVLPLQLINRSDSIEVSGWSFPTGDYINVPLGASGMIFKAPKNGWLVLAKQGNAANEYIQFNSTSEALGYRNQMLVGDNAPAPGFLAYCYMPMLEGQSTQIFYSASGPTLVSIFIYSKGVN